MAKELNCSEQNPEIPAFADAVALKYNKKFRRRLVAPKYIKTGEIIAIEEPYNQTLVLTKMYSHCWKCLDEVWKTFHDVECKVLRDFIDMMGEGERETSVAALQSTIMAKKEFDNIEN